LLCIFFVVLLFVSFPSALLYRSFFSLWFSHSFCILSSTFAHICLYLFSICLYIFWFWLLYWLLFVFSSSVSISLSLLLWKRLMVHYHIQLACVVSIDHTWIYWISLFIIIIKQNRFLVKIYGSNVY
jgi:hypothetical protein